MYLLVIFTAENSSKSDQYVTPNKDGRFYLFLSRVCMGTFYSTDKPQVKIRRPPERNNSILFDSLVGQMPGKHYREFVIYDRNQCYPEYLIEFKRV
jgi:hypothetical protein